MVESAAMIQPVIEAAGTLIVNGDTAELHVAECRERAEREVASLRERCARAGTRLKLLAGNHDPNLVNERHLQFYGRKVFITHGDAIEESVAPWSNAARRMRKQHRALLSVPSARRIQVELVDLLLNQMNTRMPKYHTFPI